MSMSDLIGALVVVFGLIITVIVPFIGVALNGIRKDNEQNAKRWEAMDKRLISIETDVTELKTSKRADHTDHHQLLAVVQDIDRRLTRIEAKQNYDHERGTMARLLELLQEKDGKA